MRVIARCVIVAGIHHLPIQTKGLGTKSFVAICIVVIASLHIVGNPIGEKTLIFTFDGKILPMLILILDMWQNTYGWIPSL